MDFTAKKKQKQNSKHWKTGISTIKLLGNSIALIPNNNKEGLHEWGCTHVAFGMCDLGLMALP